MLYIADECRSDYYNLSIGSVSGILSSNSITSCDWRPVVCIADLHCNRSLHTSIKSLIRLFYHPFGCRVLYYILLHYQRYPSHFTTTLISNPSSIHHFYRCLYCPFGCSVIVLVSLTRYLQIDNTLFTSSINTSSINYCTLSCLAISQVIVTRTITKVDKEEIKLIILTHMMMVVLI